MRLREVFVYSAIGLLTERRQTRHLREMAGTGRVDVVFQPVPISPRALSLVKLPGKPVFFGPLNGAMDYPSSFRRKSGPVSDLLIRAGRQIAEPLHRLFSAKARAAGVFLSNPRTLDALPKVMRRVTRYRSFDATVDSKQWRHVSRGTAVAPDHFLLVGRLVDWKAVDCAIRAIHALNGRARLTIVGDGPERAALERLAATGPGQIDFAGYQSHDHVRDLYDRVTAQLLPSLREAGGNVCMEALAAGVPMIATRWGGALDVIRDGVDDNLIAPDSEGHLIAGFAAAMRDLMDNPARAAAMGAAGRARVLEAFSWQTKARDYLTIFEQTRNSAPSTKPDGHLIDAHPGHADPAHRNCAWPDESQR